MASDRNQSFEERDDWDNQARKWGVEPEDRHVIGLMGEMAFAIYADLEIDAEIMRWSDGGVDFDVSIDGIERTVDVKTSRKEPYALPVKEWRVDSEYYVLAHLEGALEPSLEDVMVNLVGTATKEMVLDAERKKSNFDHYNYEVPVSSLNPIPDPESIFGM
ncbi:hypothetical protein PN416_06375 [Halorubrum ezzemoulense]|nr:hypothetical protein [Halorubrum ezzemoulense]MDB9279982.1 hypothetical protein [Halorubrum ezzemoulense]MDB9283063.1 hypothetical protein [Halorubrum ezzemoulense]